MIIRKLFKFEGAHIVRNCSSIRCKTALHGHSYKVEVFVEATKMDNAQMVLDFGLFKILPIKDFIDSFDHTYVFWEKESDEFITFVKKYSARWIQMSVSPTAEMFALMFFYIIDKILQAAWFRNGEGDVRLHSVRVHETDTGYAEAFREDLINIKQSLNIVFSKTVQDDWSREDWFEELMSNDLDKSIFRLPTIKLDIYD